MTIAVGYLPTPEGRAALHYAVREAAVHRSDLLILVADDVPGRDPFDADLAAARAGVPGRAVTLRAVPSDQDAAVELVDLSYEDSTELLVIGVRRRSPVGKLFLGSNSQQVLLEAGCPVVAVKPPVAVSG